MAEVKQFKVVSALPGTLEANSIYYVRAGAGVDIYVTNSSGTIVAYRHNQPTGSAANADLTTNHFDTTAGRVTRVNDFGQGALALSVTGLLTDLNNVDIPSGVYAYAAGTTGAPDGSNGVIEVQRFSAAASRQIARTVNGGAVAHSVYERQVRVGPVFDPWVSHFHSGNQLTIGTTQASAQAAIGVAGLPDRVLALETKPWTGAADYNAITEGVWTVTSALANAPAQFTGGHDSIVTVKRLDGDRLVQQVYNFNHNISVFRMRIMWQGSPAWAGWQEPATLDDWTPITSLLNGYTPLAGFPNRFRQLGKCLQLQLYANAASATRTAGTTIWSVPFLYRPAHLYPIQARVDLSTAVGQWSNSVSLIIDGDLKLGPALGAGVQKIAIDVLIPLGAP